MAVAKVRAEVEEWRATEELKARVAARRKATLAVAETAAEEAEMEQAVRLPAKQKGRVKGERLACDRCAVQGFDCQVSRYFLFVLTFLTVTVGDGSQKVPGVRRMLPPKNSVFACASWRSTGSEAESGVRHRGAGTAKAAEAGD